MEITTFEKAKSIRDEINLLNQKRIKIEKMKSRDNDEDFNSLRQTAHDAVCHIISQLEYQFREL